MWLWGGLQYVMNGGNIVSECESLRRAGFMDVFPFPVIATGQTRPGRTSDLAWFDSDDGRPGLACIWLGLIGY
jgi:hypothetical protein